MARLRKTVVWLVLGAAAVLAGVTAMSYIGTRTQLKPYYRIGWESVPPYQVASDTGEPTGLAIDIVKKAAARRGIALQWVYRPDSSDSALRSGEVDLWPIMGILQERKGHIHLTEPYMESEYLFLVPAQSRFVKASELAHATVSCTALPLNEMYLRPLFPDIRLIRSRDARSALDLLCGGEVDAVFLEQVSAFWILLEGVSCPHSKFRIVKVNGPRIQRALGSTLEAENAAEALRDQISDLADQGELAQIVSRWSYVAGMDIDALSAWGRTRRRFRVYRFSLGALALLLAFAVWAAAGFRRERNKARNWSRALHESDRTLRLVTDNLSDMVLAFDMRRNLTYANPGLEKFTGFNAAEIRERGFLALVHPDDSGRVRVLWERLYLGHSFEQERYRLVSRSNEVKWSSASWGPIHDESGAQVGVQGIERDITKQKQAEDALNESEEKIRAVCACAPDAIIMLDGYSRVLLWNPGAERLFGYSPEDMIGRNISDVIAGPPRNEVQQAISSGDIRPGEFFELTAVRKGGTEFPVELSLSTMESGNVLRSVMIIRDISERTRAEEEQARLREQFQQAQKMEAVGRLAGGIAHDFNNLLTVINGHSELLLITSALDESARNGLSEISSAGERAAGLVRQLLAFSRKQVLENSVLDLNTVVGDLHKLLTRVVGEDIDLKLNLEAAPASVCADPQQLEQVVFNLAVNARDAMPKGGRLTIDTGTQELDGVCRTCGGAIERGSYVRLSVRDTGIGMNDQTRSHIFEPFFTTKQLGKGTGLGLSAVHGIVMQSGGHIDVESTPGQGTDFHIYLPLVKSPATAGTEPHELRCAKEGETILLVEDQTDVRRSTAAILRLAGFRVLEAGGGEEALSICQSAPAPIHLLLTDIVMPGMDGAELAGRLSRLRPGVKLLYMSGYTDDMLVHHGAVNDSTAFISKPFTPRRLCSKIRETLG
jgi:PAS domain S-box-containing protein